MAVTKKIIKERNDVTNKTTPRNLSKCAVTDADIKK
jgi:hypothetical protein